MILNTRLLVICIFIDTYYEIFVLLYLTKLQKSSEFSEETPVNLHGTLIAQEILHFNKPIKLVNSIMASDSEKLCQILSDPRGCHITDAFMTSPTIGEKSRESLIKTLQQNGLGMFKKINFK